MPGPQTGNPVGRPPEARNRAAAGAARQYSIDAIRILAMVMYDPNAPLSQRIHAANSLLDRAHGKPQQSVELLDQRQSETELRTVEEIRAEIKRRGYDRVLDLTLEYVGDDQDSKRPKAISDKAAKPARTAKRRTPHCSRSRRQAPSADTD
jgi:hypothetical protein